MAMLSRRALAAALVVSAGTAFAAGGTPPTDISWPQRGEALRYHSCGCGDACWVADVVDRRSHAVKARLRCDCEQLSFSAKPAAADSEVALGRCEVITDSPDKLAAIRDRMAGLVDRPAR